MKKTLLIMAAGLGSRYGGGGHKQVVITWAPTERS